MDGAQRGLEDDEPVTHEDMMVEIRLMRQSQEQFHLMYQEDKDATRLWREGFDTRMCNVEDVITQGRGVAKTFIWIGAVLTGVAAFAASLFSIFKGP